MKEIIQKNSSKYTFVINNFEGPLDLLIFLISKNKMNIFDISLSELTDRYIEYLNEMSEMDLEITSEFIVMASTLLDLKSRKLLPEIEPKDEEEITEEDIILKLVEYKKYKEISEQIKNMYEINFGGFSKSPERINYKSKTGYTGDKLEIMKLFELYTDMIERNENKINAKASEIQKLALYERITVKDKVKQIVNYLKNNKSMIFNDMFSSQSCTNIEIVTAFLGMLELSKLKHISVEQKQLFSDICLTKNENLQVKLDLANILE